MKPIIMLSVCLAMLVLAILATALITHPVSVEGTVQNVTDDRLAILSEGEDTQSILEVEINDKTKFDESLPSLEDLQEGDQVKVEYSELGKERVALSIAKVAADGV